MKSIVFRKAEFEEVSSRSAFAERRVGKTKTRTVRPWHIYALRRANSD